VKPAPFDYHAPETVDGCLDVLAEFGDEAKVLAGGQSLVPLLALRLARPAHLVDVNRVGALATVRRDDGVLVVGATTRHVTLERDPGIGAAVPLLRRAAAHIGHVQIRNRGTVGGSLAHGDPAAELPSVARVLDAEFEVVSVRGTRRIAARDFFETVFTTALEPDELLVAIRFPMWAPGAGFAVTEVSRRNGDFALVGAMVGVELDGGRIGRVAIGLTGMGRVPERAAAVEASLVGAEVAGLALDEIGAAAVRDLDPSDDVHATARYRKQVGAALVGRALARALEEAADA